MTIQEIIEKIINYINPEAQNNTALYMWVDILENRILREITPQYTKTEIVVVPGETIYESPVSFYDIVKITVDGSVLSPADLVTGTEGYYNAGNGEIGFSKAPQTRIEIVSYMKGEGGRLVVPDAYADIYAWYLLAMYEQSQGNIGQYNNYMIAFNNSLSEYKTSLAKQKYTGVAVNI